MTNTARLHVKITLKETAKKRFNQSFALRQARRRTPAVVQRLYQIRVRASWLDAAMYYLARMIRVKTRRNSSHAADGHFASEHRSRAADPHSLSPNAPSFAPRRNRQFCQASII